MNKDKIKFIAKRDSWFKENTRAKLVKYLYTDSEGSKSGLFEGVYIVGEDKDYDTFWHGKGYKEGDEVTMREICSYNEFIMSL